jgi:AGZA family xanthine/uracil permease-like MFS transporter
MGLFANMPIALAPGMGLNAYFAYTVVGFHGNGTSNHAYAFIFCQARILSLCFSATGCKQILQLLDVRSMVANLRPGMVPYEVALTAVFVEGFVFVGLTILGIRQWLARAIPSSIKLATGVGIGLYLTIIGLTYSAGIGLITGAQATPLELAGCVQSLQDPDTGVCPGSYKMRSPTMWIGIFCGGILTVMLMMYRVKGAIIFGILLVSIISWPRPTSVTYFPHTELGDGRFDFFKKVVTFHPISRVLAVQQWDISGHAGQWGLAFITFLYVDILDCKNSEF